MTAPAAVRRPIRAALLAATALAAGCGGGGPSPPPAGAGAAADTEAGGPVATVRVEPIRRGTVEATLTAFGTVVAAVGEAQTFSVPFECRVRRIRVTPGQAVEAGTALVDVEPSPEARLELEQARADRVAAQARLDAVSHRLELHLATREDQTDAERTARDAELRVASLEERGIDGPATLRAAGRGVISRVAAQQGDLAAAGAPLVEVVDEGRIEVKLGVEDEDVGRLRPGQAVRLAPVNAPPQRAVEGRIRRITRLVDPATRLVDVYAAPTAASGLLLAEYVEGRLVVDSRDGLVVPRAAVLPREGRSILYTVAAGRAVEHEVEVGLDDGARVLVTGGSLAEGMPAVVVGNAALEDGMAVAVDAAP
jgi:membrane fusion protein, multidrug efflux system